jgi:hypothetical protein
LKQGMMGYAQAIPQMALQGQADPVDALSKMAKLIELREKGKSVHDAVLEVFTPKEAPAGAPGQNPLDMLAGGAAAGPEGAPQGGPPGAPPGGGGPNAQVGGMDIQRLLAGLSSSGQATASVQTRRQSPIA